MSNINDLLLRLYTSKVGSLKTMFDELYSINDKTNLEELPFNYDENGRFLKVNPRKDIIKNPGDSIAKFRNFSYPFLIYIWEDFYLKARLKIVIFGEESFGWETNKIKDYIDENSVKILMDLYISKGVVPNRGPFGNCLNRIRRETLGEGSDPRSIVWNNINKFGLSGDSGGSRNIVLRKEEKYFNVFSEELRILDPDACIFLTGPNYDDALKRKLDIKGYAVQFKDVVDSVTGESYDPKEFAMLECPGILPKHSYRLRHPFAIQRSPDKEKKIEYEKILKEVICRINSIKK